MEVLGKVLLFALFAVIIAKVDGANILGLMGIASPSHHIWNSALMHELGAKGHNVTILSVDMPKKGDIVPENIHYIYLDNVYQYMLHESYEETFDLSRNISDYSSPSVLIGIYGYYYFCYKNGKGVWESKGHKTLLNYPDNFKFDLVVYDYTCGGFLLPFLHKFNYPPLLGVSAFLNPPITQDIVGGHMYPAYIPFSYTQYDKYMGFSERLSNTIIYYSDILIRRYLYTPFMNSLVKKYWKENIPHLSELEQRTILALVNSHPAVNHPEPTPPNVIEVGGLQLLDTKPLPKDIEHFINGSKKGVIFVSLGTNMKYSDLGPTRAKMFLDAMSLLPEYNFLWKCDTNPEFEIPKNILVKPFYPQRDLLGHQSVKVFVTHCGGLSTQEAIWYGVPMVGIPLFLDQYGNFQRAMSLGVAEKIEFANLSVDILREMIVKVAEDPKYAENAKIHSRRFRDQPLRPLDTAVWWTEYVLRNPQSTHLRSPTLKLGFIRSNSLDIIFFLLIFIFISVWLLYLSSKYYFSLRKHNIKKHSGCLNKKFN